MDVSKGARIAQLAFGAVLIALGVFFAGFGGWLAVLGGSLYYLLVGVVMIASGVQVARRKPSGFFLYLGIWLITLVWAIWEAGSDPWKLEVRLLAPSVLLALFLIPALAVPARTRISTGLWRGFQAATAIAAIGLVALILVASFGPERGAQSQVVAAGPQGASDWGFYGNDAGGSRYSAAAQITPGNVRELEVAWISNSGDGPDETEIHHKGREYHSEATPLKIGNSLFTCTPHSMALAIDATTGKTRWKFDPKLPRTNPYIVCRGVAYYAAPQAAECKTRIFLPTMDARIFAIDAETGQPCRSFGNNGAVDLRDQTGTWPPGWQVSTSTPLVINDRLVIGSRVIDNMSTNAPSGVVRAFDPVSGTQAWAWDVGRSPDALPGRLPEGQEYTRSTPNVWGPITGDPKLGLVYLGTGNPSPDYYTGFRRAFDRRFGSSIVALEAATGKLRWNFQMVHDDMWDFDTPIGPSLFDTADGTPALIQTTKTGQVFMLNRATGKPIARVEERPVDQVGAVPGTFISKTQPFSVGMPSLTPPKLTPQDMWGATPLDQLMCRIDLARARNTGIFTPIGPSRSIGNPAFDGVTDWGGASVDTQNRVMFVNTMNMPFYFELVDRNSARGKELLKRKSSGGENAKKLDVRVQAGTPYLATLRAWLSPATVPCVPPPWGEMVAIDLDTRQILWRKTLGTARDNNLFGLQRNLPLPTGTPNLGGSIVTAGGLVFIGATTDQYLRAFDARTGKEVWQHRLKAGATATPMTYVGADGRQYVVITAGGHGALGTRYGDETIAFALPPRS
ncbi:membrane-bound PQQ-dependent dehydrogenase, glucose/quinate/shikimate family [Sphingomonas sp. PL-96]|uniref:membrane-bound PQQ-dependent dehydrogenase, glucose/quinate/shikimate family n=1 Tax=Sphingomonas sp. PL-96 TaxID=2887201 RepID=UPI001E332115|nr:membrane-bound PQQ-dependent dehydrogenase, glucose/quinate/shikimate family [Sphingomonas sp. PL-96]MCC2976530.1 membrane-bound PQQ-dependent dehydrogenase, glucose/quinate/shikimate family [Sphingomonas sp. PL-96]